MARPLQELLQGLQQRRQRRRSGWAGGDAPGMRDMLNPLDSQAMSDRAQGVDISSAMPPARLEARMAPREEPQEEPTGGAAVTAQLTQGGRNPFQTAAGSNAREQPTQEVQCEDGVCRPQGSAGGLDASQYGITLGPGERLLRVDGMAGGGVTGGATASAAPTTVSPAPGGAAAPATTPDAWNSFTTSFKALVADPKNATWMNLAQFNAEQAERFNTLANMSPDIASKHFWRKQAIFYGSEAVNSVKAAIMQAEKLRSEVAVNEQWNTVNRRLDAETLEGKTREMMTFLTRDNNELTPDYRAAVFVGRRRQLAGLPAYESEQEMMADPEFKTARSIAHAGRIATYATNELAAGRPTAWGTEEIRRANGNMAWNAARQFYGAMPLGEAQQAINDHFVPSMNRTLSELNASRPEDQRVPAAEIQEQAQMAGLQLYSYLYYLQQAQAQQQQQQEVAPMRRTSRGSRPSRPSDPAPAPSWAGESTEDPFMPPAEQDQSFVPSRAMLLNRK